jgi:hypothetical protein
MRSIFFVFAPFAPNIFCFCLLGRVKVRDTAPGAGCSWAVSPPGGLVHRPSAVVVVFFYFCLSGRGKVCVLSPRACCSWGGHNLRKLFFIGLVPLLFVYAPARKYALKENFVLNIVIFSILYYHP